MKRGVICICILLLFSFYSLGPAGAAVLTFDDITFVNWDGEVVNPYGDPIPDGYGGLTWESWRVWSNSGAPSFPNVATSYCDGGYVGISSPVDFNFHGAYFSRFEDSQSAASTITVAGFNDGVLVATPTELTLSAAYTWFQLDILNIDRITFTPGSEAYNPYIQYPNGYFDYPDGMGWFGMDNFTYSAPVPEPNTLTLLGVGLFALVVYGRKKIRK